MGWQYGHQQKTNMGFNNMRMNCVNEIIKYLQDPLTKKKSYPDISCTSDKRQVFMWSETPTYLWAFRPHTKNSCLLPIKTNLVHPKSNSKHQLSLTANSQDKILSFHTLLKIIRWVVCLSITLFTCYQLKHYYSLRPKIALILIS